MDPKSKKGHELRFICPECGVEDMLCADYTSWVEIDHIYADGGYDGSTFHNDIVTFSCGECSYVLTDEKGNKVYQEDLAEWISKNCPQTDEDLGQG